MAWLTGRVRRITGFLLSEPTVVPVLTVAYIVAGVVLVLTDYTLNDEGLLAHYWASWARREFVPVFFFQRVKPVLSALYLPASAGGVHATLAAHVVIAALSLPLLAASARALGHRLSNLAALVAALSPLYFYGGPAGFSNADGVVGISLTVYLLTARRHPFLAGLVAGLLPWARFELAIFCAVLALYGLLSRRDRPLLAGLAVFPVLYATAGAFYHHDLLWLLHFPPATPVNPSDAAWESQLVGARHFLEPLLAVTPLAAIIAALRPARLQPVERMLLAYLVVMAVLINVLPTLRLANFGTPPRYSLCLLPPLALLAGRAFEPWWEGERAPPAALAAVSVFAVWLATRQEGVITVAVILIAYVLLVAAAASRRGTAAAAVAIALMAVGPLLPLRLEIGRAPFLEQVVDWLQAHRDRITGPILTNSQLLAPMVERRMPGLDVRFLAWTDISLQMTLLSNPANGQQDRIQRLCETDLYGRTKFPPIKPEDFPPGTLLALRDDMRLEMLLPDAVWGPRLEVLVDTPQYRIARLKEGAP